MRKFMKVSLAAGAGAFALVAAGIQTSKAADMPYPQEQYEAPPQAYAPPAQGAQAYGPPPVEESYGYPPPVAYSPPPVPYYGYGPAYVIVPGPYYVRGPYWRGYAPRYAYGYGHWGHGYRHW